MKYGINTQTDIRQAISESQYFEGICGCKSNKLEVFNYLKEGNQGSKAGVVLLEGPFEGVNHNYHIRVHVNKGEKQKAMEIISNILKGNDQSKQSLVKARSLEAITE